MSATYLQAVTGIYKPNYRTKEGLNTWKDEPYVVKMHRGSEMERALSAGPNR